MNKVQMDLAITGASVKNYTDAANLLEAVGADVDALIASDDTQSHIEAASNAYLHLQSLRNCVNAFVEDINGYLDAINTAPDAVEDSCTEAGEDSNE